MLNSIALFNGLTEKMNYLQSRQRVLSQNISNADSPGYASVDLKKPDFSKSMARFMHGGSTAGQSLTLASTNPAHATHLQLIDRAVTGDPVRQPYEVTMDKNGVNLEEQMMAASQTAGDYQLITNIYSKNVDMLRAAMKA